MAIIQSLSLRLVLRNLHVLVFQSQHQEWRCLLSFWVSSFYLSIVSSTSTKMTDTKTVTNKEHNSYQFLAIRVIH